MRDMALFGYVCAVTTALLAGCGGAADSPLLGGDGGSGTDASSGGDGDGGADGGGNCDTSRCPTIPDGFQLVHFASATGCPSGWSETDVVSNPTAADGACTCDCDVTQQPSCDVGDVTRNFDSNATPTCDTAGLTLPANQGGCSQTGTPLDLNRTHYQVNPVAPTGGTCSFTATADVTKVTSTAGTLCAPPMDCEAAACDASACVAQDGDVACPTGFPNKTLVGTSANAACSDCGACTVGAVCSGTMEFFTDTACTQGEADFTADGQCKDNFVASTSYFYSYSYTGSLVSSSCSAATSTATPSLDGKKTVCCP